MFRQESTDKTRPEVPRDMILIYRRGTEYRSIYGILLKYRSTTKMRYDYDICDRDGALASTLASDEVDGSCHSIVNTFTI